MFDSFRSRAEDDGTPAAAARIASEAIRDLNHRTRSGPVRREAGWEHPSDAHRVLGRVAELAGRLPQALEQVERMLLTLQSAGCVDINRGTEWAGNPAGAVDAAALVLLGARQAADILRLSVDAAQQAIAVASYRDTGQTDTVGPQSTPAARGADRVADPSRNEVDPV